MIGTEQERAALMAAVEQYGIHKMQFALSPDGSASEQLADDRADHYFDAIRAMLAPDDAVVIPRALAERLQDASEIVAFIAHGNDDQVTNESRMADAEALRAVLRGEATRDE